MTQENMVLAKDAIIRGVKNGSIFISNFDERQVNNCSYDVRLGSWYYQEQGSMNFDLFDPYDKDSVKAMFGEPKKAVVPDATYPIQSGIDRGLIAVPPGGFILAHTEEFIGCADTVHTTMIKGRSTSGRSAFQICSDAGWGDIGFATRWTLEIKNNSQRHTLILRPGQRIGQIVFIPTTGVSDEDLYSVRGKYQAEDLLSLTSNTHEYLDQHWSPEQMLPRAYEDWDADRFTCETPRMEGER